MVWDLCGPPDSSLNSIGFNVFWKRYYVSNVLLVICFSIFYLFIYPSFFFSCDSSKEGFTRFFGCALGALSCTALYISHSVCMVKKIKLANQKRKGINSLQ